MSGPRKGPGQPRWPSSGTPQAAIAGYIGKGQKFTAAISRFAQLYADQNKRDDAQLVSAIAVDALENLPR